MIVTRDRFQGDLLDPITGERLVLRIPVWFGAAALASSTEITAPLDTTDAPPPSRGVWTDGGYLPPGSF